MGLPRLSQDSLAGHDTPPTLTIQFDFNAIVSLTL